MDKKINFAVAGSGKTTYILNNLDIAQRSLIVTYTRENRRNIVEKLTLKYGEVPERVTVMTYFTFLYSFCFKPFFGYRCKHQGINWNPPECGPSSPSKESQRHYVTKHGYLYSSRISKLITLDSKILEKVNDRLSTFFDKLYVDEVQDFAANDFNFLLQLGSANIDILCVGDYYQHTFSTGVDGRTRINLYKNGIDAYLKEFQKAGYNLDPNSLEKSWRCSPSICSFIEDNTGINISSHKTVKTEIRFVDDRNEAEKIFKSNDIVKLFYDEHHRYRCYSNNWGKSKGLDEYKDVCIVLNKTTLSLFKSNKLDKMAETTKNKFYVACTRASGNLYFVPYNYLDKFKT